MNKEKSNQLENVTSKVVEDLTLKETDAAQVKGGPFGAGGYSAFGIEREMKESDEKF
jgi:hypothetical protein